MNDVEISQVTSSLRQQQVRILQIKMQILLDQCMKPLELLKNLDQIEGPIEIGGAISTKAFMLSQLHRR